ncbi:MAG: hypothetical protein ACXADB_05555 [Candidatus Hermodarchaeia archaeon]
MSVSEIARKIQRVYAKRFGRVDGVSVEMDYRRYYVARSYHSGARQEKRTEDEKYTRKYSAQLMYGDKCLADASSKESFDEAIIKLAEQLEVVL